MARGRRPLTATVGVTEHANSAVLVTVAPGGELLDRRRIDLTDRGLPTHPHHHEGSWAVGRYLNTPGARALSLARRRGARRARARVRRARRARGTRGAGCGGTHADCEHRDPRVPEASADDRGADHRQSRADLRRLGHVSRGPRRAQPRRAAGPCIGTTASAYFSTRPWRSAARTSTLSWTRWADRSGRLGRRSTSLPRPRRSRSQRAVRTDQRSKRRRRVRGGASTRCKASAVSTAFTALLAEKVGQRETAGQ